MQLEELSNISDNLAMMPDPALQQFAQMHKSDPYMVSLALSESNRRKKMRMAAQGQAGAMPQPKVVDAAIQGMQPAPAPVAQTQLPENQGIAQIPTPNMQGLADGGIAGYGDDEEGMAQGGMYDFAQRSEPVLRMAGGGMTGYMPGFKNTGAVNAAFEAALEKTLKYEGGYVKDDAGKGPSNFGINASANPDVDVKNLTKDKARELYKKRYWDAIGGDALAAKDPALATIAFDTAVNMGVSKASQLIAQSKGDPSAMLSLRQQHYDNLIKDNPKKFASFEKGWKDRVADLATSVIPSAEAGTLPKAQAAAPADASAASQILGQTVQAPASNYDQTNSFFGRMADKMGIPLEAQRQIGTTLNAPTPLAPVVGSAKSGSGIVALGEKIGDKLGLLKGPAGSMSKAEIAALKNEQAGLRALENSQLAMKDAQSAGATLDEQEYLRKMIETRRAAEAPSKAAQIAEASQLREAGDVATAQRLAQTGERAQTAGRVDALADRVTPASTPEAAPTLGADQRAPVRYDEFGPPNIGPEALDLTKKEMDAVAKDAKEATPVEARKGLTNDDYLMMGLNLLASKAPNFATAFGEAGVATLGAKRAREKDEREEAKLKGSEELQKAQAKYYGAYAGAIERGAKEKNDELEAEKLVRQYMGDWERNNKIANIQDPTARLQEEARIRQQIYTSLGLTSIMPKQAGSASQSDPLGILNKR